MAMPTDTAALYEEGEVLHRAVERSLGALHAVTPFAGWTGIDVFVHLVYLDWMAVLAIDGDGKYGTELGAFSAAIKGAAGMRDLHGRIAQHERTRVGTTSVEAVISQWRHGLDDLCRRAADHDGDDRLQWFGRELSVQRLVDARQMEVFAYGQDVADLLRIRRAPTDRLRAVAAFAVRTFRFSFANRGLPVPERVPYVALDAPSGARWTWGDEDAGGDRVEGPAEDFCLVATRRRHVADTALRATGSVADTWLRIAQTIAGPPDDGPAPGERTW